VVVRRIFPVVQAKKLTIGRIEDFELEEKTVLSHNTAMYVSVPQNQERHS
jgi:hypothetical protein